MSLIKCPECGKEVSTLAEACPHCGCPLKKSDDPNKLTSKQLKEYYDARTIAIYAGSGSSFVLGVLCIVFGLIMGLNTDGRDRIIIFLTRFIGGAVIIGLGFFLFFIARMRWKKTH